MALEGFLYGDPPDGSEIRSLLVRALVAAEDDDGREEWRAIADGLARAYCAFLDATEDEEAVLMEDEPSDYTPDRGERLTGDAAWKVYNAAWVARYARRTGVSREAAGESFCPGTGAEDAIVELTLPKGVIRDVGLAVGGRDASRARAWAEMFKSERRAAAQGE